MAGSGCLSFETFQQGTPVQYTQRFGGSIRGNRVLNQGLFLQDDWRVTRHLTLNLGVRTEIAGGVGEVNNIISNLNLDQQQSLGGAGAGPLGSINVGGKAFTIPTPIGPPASASPGTPAAASGASAAAMASPTTSSS